MTNREAIEHLKNINSRYPCSLDSTFRDECEKIAINRAIKALEARPQGEWIFRKNGYYNCSKCGEVERAEKKFCPNCGADMRGG